jgi:hypothetical protein
MHIFRAGARPEAFRNGTRMGAEKAEGADLTHQLIDPGSRMVGPRTALLPLRAFGNSLTEPAEGLSVGHADRNPSLELASAQKRNLETLRLRSGQALREV